MIYYFAHKIGGLNGADQAASDILTCLRASKRPVTVLCREQSELPIYGNGNAPELVRWLKPPRYTPFPIKLDNTFIKGLAKWVTHTLRDLPVRYSLEKQIQRDKPNLAIFNDTGPESFIVNRLSKASKTVAVVHTSPKSLSFFLQSSDPVHITQWATAASKAFDALIFVSSQTRDAWLAVEPLANKETYVIPNCCREGEVQQQLLQDKKTVRERLGISQKCFVAVCVASLQPRKGQDLLIAALPRLVEEIPDFKLYLVGSGETGGWARALRDQVVGAGLSEHVEFVGARADAVAFTYAADVFVLPSLAEAQPISILEAMALNVPVLASDIDGIPGMIQDGLNGLLFPVGDIQKLSAGLKKLHDDKGLRQLFAERAAKTYWQHFSKAHQIKRYQDVLETMLENH